MLMLPDLVARVYHLLTKTFLPLALAGPILTELGKLIKMWDLSLSNNQLTGTPPFAHFHRFGSTSLPLAFTTSSFALAGSIPTEFGKLINVETLWLSDNKLRGTPPFAHVAWLVVRVYHFLYKRPHWRWQGRSPPS